MTFRIPWGSDHHIRFHRPWVRRDGGPRPIIELHRNEQATPARAGISTAPRNAALPGGSVPRGAPAVFERTVHTQGTQYRVMLDQASASRILNQSSARHGPLVRAAFEAATSARLTAEPPVAGRPGIADYSFRHNGQVHEASFDFGVNGRVRRMQIISSVMGPLVNVSLPQPTVPVQLLAADPARVLTLPAGLSARFDVQGQVASWTEGDNRVYSYAPRGDHRLVVDIEPGGVLHLKLVMVNDAYRDTLGTGTDMFLGVAKALIADGVGISHVRAKWLNEEGRDSQFQVIAAADRQGRDLAKAAARMFSGKQADKYGFTQVQVNRTEDGGYEATFRRGAMPAWMATLFAGFGAPGGSS